MKPGYRLGGWLVHAKALQKDTTDIPRVPAKEPQLAGRYLGTCSGVVTIKLHYLRELFFKINICPLLKKNFSIF